MNWIDALTLASRSLRRRPGRALLTILAVTLGTTLLVALASVADSAGSRIVSKLSNGGPATAIKVSASKADSDQLYTDDLRAAGPKAINDATISAARRSSRVATVIPVMASRILALPPPFGSSPASTPGEPAAFGDTMVGVDLSQPSNLPVTVLAGRLPHAGSLTEVAIPGSFGTERRRRTRHPGRDRRATSVPGPGEAAVSCPLGATADCGDGLTAAEQRRLPGAGRAARSDVGARRCGWRRHLPLPKLAI